MNNNQIRISAKNLGAIAMPNYCPRCQWIKLKCKLPYQIFPGIFSSIDSYSKSIAWTYFNKYKKLPPWFDEFGDFDEPIKVPGWSKFFLINDEYNIKLTGVTDEIIRKTDGTYCIIDYKTSRLTKFSDSLHNMYKVQLNGYALIAEHIGISPVSQLVLLYYEPQTDIIEITTEDLEKLVSDDSFKMGFKAKSKKVELDAEGIVKPLLKEVRKLGDMEQAPEGREGCEDCRLMGELMNIL